MDTDKDGNVQSTAIYFKNSDIISSDITSDTFLNDKSMTKYLYSNKHPQTEKVEMEKKVTATVEKETNFPKIWSLGGTVQGLPKGRRHVGFYGKTYYWDNFPVEHVLTYPINDFKIHVNDTDYFLSNLPPLNITTKDSVSWSLKEPYYQSLVGTWIATYASGISTEHLTFKPEVPKQITSLMRFHPYFTVRKIMKELETLKQKDVSFLLNKYKANFLKDRTPKRTWQEATGYKKEHLGQNVVDINKYGHKHGPSVGFIRDVKNDYKKFVPNVSNGLTIQGTELLNQSIEAYIYSVLGAQARTKQSIYGTKASASETQEVFRQIVEDPAINYNTST